MECRSQKINGVPWSEVNTETMRPRRKGWGRAEEQGVRFPPKSEASGPFRTPGFPLPTRPRDAALRDCPAPCERTQCRVCQHSAASKVYAVPQTCLVSVPRSSIHHPFCARSFKGAVEMMGALPIWMRLFHRMLPTLGPRRSGRREVESLPKIQAGKAGSEKVLGKRMGV